MPGKRRTVDGKHSTLWQAREVLYARCPACNNHMAWRIFEGTSNLNSTCCGFIYTAEPFFQAQKYRISCDHVDMSNVIPFPIYTEIDCPHGA